MQISLTNKILIGKTSLDLIETIIQSCFDIEKIQIVSYSYTPPIQDRISHSEDIPNVLQAAMIHRQRLKIPFWDACMITLSSGQYSVSNDFIHEVGHHDSHHGSERFIDRNEVLENKLQSLIDQPSNKLIGILSEVILRNNYKLNLPLLDFHCPISDNNKKLVFQICKELVPQGFVILESDSSYHCFGLALFSNKELIDFLAKALFYSPIIDRAYIAHQLLEKRCSLRITQKSKTGKLPKVVEIYQEDYAVKGAFV